MNTVDVHLKNVDENAKYLYPNRTVEIRTTSSSTIETPTRAATDYEFNQKAQIPTEIPIDNQAFVSSIDLNSGEFEKFMHTNGYYSNVIGRMELKSRVSIYSNLRLFLLKPTTTDRINRKTKVVEKYAPMSLLVQNSSLREQFIRSNLQMQIEVGLNLITIPFFKLPFNEYKQLIDGISTELERINRQPLFFIDMGYDTDNFSRVIDYLINIKQANLVGLYHRSYRQANLSYETLKKYVSKDVAFISTNVSRSDLSNDISTMHYLPFFYNDIYSIKRPLGFTKTTINEKGETVVVPPDYSVNNIQLFDPNSLCVRGITKSPELVEHYLEQFRKDQPIKDILTHYREADGNAEKYEVLKAFSRISELKMSLSEFQNYQKYIKQNATRDYVEQKGQLKSALKQLRY